MLSGGKGFVFWQVCCDILQKKSGSSSSNFFGFLFSKPKYFSGDFPNCLWHYAIQIYLHSLITLNMNSHGGLIYEIGNSGFTSQKHKWFKLEQLAYTFFYPSCKLRMQIVIIWIEEHAIIFNADNMYFLIH